MVAQDVSPGVCARPSSEPRRGDRETHGAAAYLSPLRGWPFFRTPFPGLTPWAKFYRASGAEVLTVQTLGPYLNW